MPSHFEIPTSDDYNKVEDPTNWNKTFPLYPRQKRALGRMETIEDGLVDFVEEEKRVSSSRCRVAFEGKELTTAIRGGVLGDVMGGGKTAKVLPWWRVA